MKFGPSISELPLGILTLNSSEIKRKWGRVARQIDVWQASPKFCSSTRPRPDSIIYISTSGANEWNETARARLCGAAESCATPERLNERLRTHNCRPRSCSSCFNQLVNSTVSHSCRRLVVSSAWLSLAAVCNTSWDTTGPQLVCVFCLFVCCCCGAQRLNC